MFKLKSFTTNIFFILFCVLILILSIRGIPGNPTENTINESRWKDDGPFELSPDRGRIALAISIIENKTLYFTLPIARFATPDLGYNNGQYVSLFAPILSYVILPGFILGKYFNLAQIGAFSIISLFALFNCLLIRSIAILIKSNRLAATIAGFTFLFATPAYTYGVTLYQHHLSTFLILSSLYLLIKYGNFIALTLVWLMFGISISLDYPNFFLMLPIALFTLGKIIYTNQTEKTITFNFKPLLIFSFASIILPIIFFLWFNNASNGNPFVVSGSLASVKSIDANGKALITTSNDSNPRKIKEAQTEKKNILYFFHPRNIVDGLYTQFLSPDRGIIYFTPIVLFGFIGWFLLYPKNQRNASLFMALIAVNILLYAMWYDRWGGWAFGGRYLIPAYSILSILIAFFLTRFRKKMLILLIYLIILSYSIAVNSLGAITSSRNPPQVEILSLEKLSGKIEKYTYERNWDYLNANNSKSFVWQAFGKYYLTAPQYYYTLTGLLLIAAMSLVISLRLSKSKI